jgi:hypothetical protein
MALPSMLLPLFIPKLFFSSNKFERGMLPTDGNTLFTGSLVFHCPRWQHSSSWLPQFCGLRRQHSHCHGCPVFIPSDGHTLTAICVAEFTPDGRTRIASCFVEFASDGDTHPSSCIVFIPPDSNTLFTSCVVPSASDGNTLQACCVILSASNGNTPFASCVESKHQTDAIKKDTLWS